MTLVSDGNLSFEGGQHDRRSNAQVAANQYLRGVNVKTGNDELSPRPGYVHKKITVITSGRIQGLSYQSVYSKGKFQAECAEIDGGPCSLTVRSGVLFRVNPARGEAEVIPLPNGDRMNQYRRRIPWSRAGRFVVFFDYPNEAVIVENGSARRADPTKEFLPGVPAPELPTAVLGAEVSNRLWVANRGHSFIAGDPIGPGFPDAPISFNEVLAPAAAFSGQSLTLGSHAADEQITAMGTIPSPDLPNGIGALFIATGDSISSGRTDLPRDQWENTAFTKAILFTGGMSGPRAFANQNTDLIFIGNDNQVRSLLLSRTEQERWSNAPISLEVERWLKEYERKDLLDIAFVFSSGNRVFIGVGPYSTEALNLRGQKVFDYAHAGMIVLEMNNASGLGQNAAPAWAGLWTGVYPMEMVTLSSGTYVISKDDGSVNQMYLLDENSSVDIHDGIERPITCRVYTRNFDFQSQLAKKVSTILYSLSDIKGNFQMRVDYKPKHVQNWALWKCFEHKAPVSFESFDSAGEMPVLEPHSFSDLNLGDPDEVGIDGVSGDNYLTLESIGLRLTITADDWKLGAIKLAAETVDTIHAELPDFNLESREIKHRFERSDWDIHSTAPRGNVWL